MLCRPVLDRICHYGRHIGTSIVSIILLLKLSTRVVDFMPHHQSKFQRREDSLVHIRNQVLQDINRLFRDRIILQGQWPN